MRIERKVTWYDDPDEADAAVREHYENMTPQERLDEMVEMLNRWGKWNERRIVRVAQIIEIPERTNHS